MLFDTNVLARLRPNNRLQGQPSNCQNFNVSEDFEISRFNGVWYEVFAYPHTLAGDCVMSSYACDSDGNIKIFTRFKDFRGMQNRIIGMAATISQGILSVSFSAARKFRT